MECRAVLLQEAVKKVPTKKLIWRIGNILLPYPCSQFCADIKFDIRFDIKLGDSFHVNHTINFGTKLRSYGIV